MIRKHSIRLLILLSSLICAFNQPDAYCQEPTINSTCKNQVEISANLLDSVDSIFSYEYDYFGFCSGDNQSSPYKFNFLKNDECHLVCTKKFSSDDKNQQEMLNHLMKGMMLNYQQNWIIDNIPVTWCYTNIEDQEFCSQGFPIGCYVTKSGQSKESCNIRDGKNDTFYVFNHLDFEIIYHSEQDEARGRTFASRIVAANVKLNSLYSKDCERYAEPIMFRSTTKNVEIPFTYSVKFVENNNISWINEQEQRAESSSIEPFSIFNSYFIILLLSVVIGLILLTILHKITNHYTETIDDVNKEYISKDLEQDTKEMLNNNFQFGMILLIACTMTFLGLFSLLTPGILILCCIIMLMMCDAVERWQKIAVISFSSVSILLFLLNRVIWESDGSGDISSVGFLFVLYMALIITSAQTTILLSHFLRRTKNFNCWWQSCLTLGFTAVYLFLYSVYYFTTNLNISDGASIFIDNLSLLTGFVEFFACFWFIRTIYDSVQANRKKRIAVIWTT